MATNTDHVYTDRGTAPDGNNGTRPVPGLTFGATETEGIASKRNAGGNQFGLDLYTAGTARLSISNTGDVGIGKQPAAGTRLDVNGVLNATEIRRNGTPLVSSQWTAVPGGITFSGDVGIGTTAPVAALHVARPAHLNVIFENTDASEHLTAVVGSSGSGLRFSNSNYFFIGSQPYGSRNDWTAGNVHLFINSNGNVGIGRTNPDTKLHLHGGRLRISESDGSSGSGVIELSNRVKNNYIFTDGSTGHLHLRTDSVSHHVLLQTGGGQGNVGIGAAQPRAKLEVAGGAIVNGVAIGGDVPGIDYPYEYETVGVASPFFNLRLQSPNSIIFHTGDAPAERMSIREDGNVYINGSLGCGGKVGLRTWRNTFVSANQFGGIGQAGQLLAWEQFTLEMACSRAFKENIVDLSSEEALGTLECLNPVKYDYRGEKSWRPNLGFIAEEMPDNLASYDRRSIAPFEVIPVLTRVAQLQQQTIATLRDTVSLLREEVRQLKAAR